MARNVEILHPVDPEANKPFIKNLYLRRTGDGVEIGFTNRRNDDYIWAIVSWDQLDADLKALRVEELFDASGA